MLVGEAVSTIVNRFRGLTMDKRLSRGYVLSEINIASRYIINQKIENNTITISKLYQPLECVEMEPVDRISCPMVELRTCKTIMRSRLKLPNLMATKYGPMIREVTTIDGEKRFRRVDKAKARREKYRPKDPLDNTFKFMIGDDGHLYVIDVEIYLLNMEIVSFDYEQLSKFNECNKDYAENCKSAWDQELKIPEDIIQMVLDVVSQKIQIERQIQVDDNPNQSELR